LRWAEAVPVSTVIIGLSSNWALPVSGAKYVDSQCAPPSAERATAISVPLIPPPAPKKTTMYE